MRPYNRSNWKQDTRRLINEEELKPTRGEILSRNLEVANFLRSPNIKKKLNILMEKARESVPGDPDDGAVFYKEEDCPKLLEIKNDFIQSLDRLFKSFPSQIVDDVRFWKSLGTEEFDDKTDFLCNTDYNYSRGMIYFNINFNASILSLVPQKSLDSGGVEIINSLNMSAQDIFLAHKSGALSDQFIIANQVVLLRLSAKEEYLGFLEDTAHLFENTHLRSFSNSLKNEAAFRFVSFLNSLPADIGIDWLSVFSESVSFVFSGKFYDYSLLSKEFSALVTELGKRNYSLADLSFEYTRDLKKTDPAIILIELSCIKKLNRDNLDPYITREKLRECYDHILEDRYIFRRFYDFLAVENFPSPAEVGCVFEANPQDYFQHYYNFTHGEKEFFISQLYITETKEKFLKEEQVLSEYVEYVGISDQAPEDIYFAYQLLKEQGFVFEKSIKTKLFFVECRIKDIGGMVEDGYEKLVDYLGDVDTEKKCILRYLTKTNFHHALHFMPYLVGKFEDFSRGAFFTVETVEEAKKNNNAFALHKKNVLKEILSKSGISAAQHDIAKEVLQSLEKINLEAFSVLQNEHQANPDATPVFSEKNRGQLNLREVLSELKLYKDPQLAELLRALPEGGSRRKVLEELVDIKGMPVARLAEFLSEQESQVAQFFASRDGAGEGDFVVNRTLAEVMPDIPANELRDLIIARNKERPEKNLDTINSFAGHYRKKEWCEGGDIAKVEYFFNQIIAQLESGRNEDVILDATDLLLNMSDHKDMQDLGVVIAPEVSESVASEFVGRVLPTWLEDNEVVVKANMFKEGRAGIKIMSRILGDVKKQYAFELLVEAKKEVGLLEKEEKQAGLSRTERKALNTLEGIQGTIEKIEESLATVIQEIHNTEQIEFDDAVVHERTINILKRKQKVSRTKLNMLEKLLSAKKIQEKKVQDFDEKMVEFTEMNSQTMSSEQYLEFWRLLYAHGPRLKKDKNKMLLQEIQRLSGAEKGEPMFQDQHKFILAMSEDKKSTDAFMAALRLSLRSMKNIGISQFEGEWYRVELLPPSDASGYGMGNITDSCDAFGNGKKADFIKNPSTAQFVIRKSKGKKPTEERWKNPDTVLSQSLATITRDVFAPNEGERGDPERRNTFLQTLIEGGDFGSAVQAAGFVTEGGKPDIRQFITTYTQANQTMCLDSVEGVGSSREVVQKAIAVLSKEDGWFDGLRVTAGMQYSNVQEGDKVPNIALNETPLAYTDNNRDVAVLLQERKEGRIHQEPVGVRPAKPQDVMIIAAIEFSAFTDSGGGGYVTGYLPMYRDLFTSVTQSLYGNSLKEASHKPLAFVDVVDKNGTNEINGYLIAHKREGDEIYISDTSTLDKASQDGQRYRSGTRLLVKLLETVATDSTMTGRKITMDCRGSTSALAIMKNKETLEGLTFPDPENPTNKLSYMINGPSIEQIRELGDGLISFSFTINR